MKKSYEKPGFTLSVFESKDPISARGDWELSFGKGPIEPYGGDDDIEEQGVLDEGDGGVNYSSSDVGSNFGWNF